MRSAVKYLSVFRIRFNAGLQYRAAALGGIATQFVWGFMTVMLYKAFYDGNPNGFPMGLEQVTVYLWLRQAFLAMFNLWTYDNSIFDAITGGNIAYELARPVDLYNLWFMKNASIRLSNVSMRCIPVLVVAFLVPAPYGMSLPVSSGALLGFVITMLLGFLVACGFLMIIYALTFYTMQPQGLRIIFSAMSELLCGNLIPLPFFPEKLTKLIELTPFASVSNVPFRIYSGNISGNEIFNCISLQVFWLVVLVLTGRMLISNALKRTVVQGG